MLNYSPVVVYDLRHVVSRHYGDVVGGRLRLTDSNVGLVGDVHLVLTKALALDCLYVERQLPSRHMRILSIVQASILTDIGASEARVLRGQVDVNRTLLVRGQSDGGRTYGHLDVLVCGVGGEYLHLVQASECQLVVVLPKTCLAGNAELVVVVGKQ